MQTCLDSWEKTILIEVFFFQLRKLIQDMRSYAEERAPAIYLTPNGETPPEPARSMVHDAAGDEALWACTSCGSCVEACPVSLNHIDTIVDMHRFLVLEEGSGPETALTTRRPTPATHT